MSGTLGERLKAKRRELGISQREAAELVSGTPGTIRRYEQDQWVPRGSAAEAAPEFPAGLQAHLSYLA